VTTGHAGVKTDVRLSSDGGRAVITLDSPDNRNALSRALVSQLAAALDQALADPAVRVVELTGTGPVFCAGADLKEPAPVQGSASEFPRVLSRLRAAGKASVCRLNGPARAGGVGLMAACDLVVAPLSATFAFTEVRLGVAPAVVSVPVLKRVPLVAARRLFLTGRTIGAAYAAEIGLVDMAVADDEVNDAAEELISDILLAGPEALSATKRLLAEVPALPDDEALSRMTALSAERFASEEAAEGLAAWREKRSPRWAVS
jgi:methylglutaconyl-CoA hydratase